MTNLLLVVFSLFLIFEEGLSGDVTVGFSPSTLRFGSASPLHASNLDDVLAASMGYTPKSVSWNGLTVTSAFHYPSAAVLFKVNGAGASVRMEGISYELTEDIPLTDVFRSLTSLVGNRAQRPIHFEHITVNNLKNGISNALPVKADSLHPRETLDEEFLQEMANLPFIVDTIENESSLNHGGQDIILVDIDTFSPLVKKYGLKSNEIKEASDILRSSIVEAMARLRAFYGDRIVIMSAMLNEEDKQTRVRRQTAKFTDEVTQKEDINLAAEYSDDFPIIFNIVLILSILLISALIAISVSMAFMDPGRDSIIYRMTNPRMKKEQ